MYRVLFISSLGVHDLFGGGVVEGDVGGALEGVVGGVDGAEGHPLAGLGRKLDCLIYKHIPKVNSPCRGAH